MLFYGYHYIRTSSHTIEIRVPPECRKQWVLLPGDTQKKIRKLMYYNCYHLI